MLVDCQSHLFPPFYPDLIEHGGRSVSLVRGDDSATIVFGHSFALKVATKPYEPEQVIRRMDLGGIDVSVMSVNMPGPELFEPEFAGEASRRCNDYVAEVCASSGGRLVGLATLPFNDTEFSVEELSRATTELDLRGVVLYSNIAGDPVDLPRFEPIFARLEELGIPLVLHPAVPSWAEVINDYSMVPMVGFMVDTSIAMLRLILSGMLERHPGLRIVHPHCGGVLPYLMPRIVEQTETKGRGRENICQAPSLYYDSVYLDLVSPSPEHIAFAVSLARADRLLFGTDAPWVDVKEMVRCFMNAKMPVRTQRLAAAENAVGLFRI